MILIITLNPLLERRFTVKQFNFGEVNRNTVVEITAGGKGINVSRQLKKFGIKSFNFLFTGGDDGKLLREKLKSEGLDHTYTPIKSSTRNAAVIISEKDKKVTSFFSDNPLISGAEADEFKSKMDKMIQNCEIVVFSGSSPSAAANDIIPLGIELANRYDKVSVCDTYGAHLQNCINASPTIIHNNIEEINLSLNHKLIDQGSVCEYLDYLYSNNIKRSYLTDGGNDFYVSNFNYIYKVTPLTLEEVDSTGSGDCFVAGLIKGWIDSDVFEDSLMYATAAAGINASMFNVANVDPKQADIFKSNVKTIPIGKKTKTIDDSPREI